MFRRSGLISIHQSGCAKGRGRKIVIYTNVVYLLSALKKLQGETKYFRFTTENKNK